MQQHKILGAFIFILISALAVMFSPLSSVPFVPAAVLIWGKIAALSFLMIGGMIGSAGTYFLGYYALYPLLKIITSVEIIEFYKKRIANHLSFWMIVLFRLAMPVEIPGYVIGIIKYEFWLYMIATFIVFLPFEALIVYASEAFLKKELWVIAISLAAIIASNIVFFFILWKKLRGRRFK
jgi:uncharacterized membrane protein YdjX (TVP38/TMEM64 family)